ncbi:unnamed protein product [Euphydryas editha]|uniref:Uncharacterized protein n=1 Tax=Euphydryas editha TaxID=104508 RepID=A0AAU9U081_EUPED|nr:unnamed protein product [Euphydryas editha]
MVVAVAMEINVSVAVLIAATVATAVAVLVAATTAIAVAELVTATVATAVRLNLYRGEGTEVVNKDLSELLQNHKYIVN